MKKMIFIFCLLIQTASYAGAWDIKAKNNGFLLFNKSNSNLKSEVITHGGTPYFVSSERKGKLDLIVYYAGSAGTKYQVSIYRAIIFDRDNNRFLGDFPFRYESKSYEVDQPQWKFLKNKIEITDEEAGGNKVIKY